MNFKKRTKNTVKKKICKVLECGKDVTNENYVEYGARGDKTYLCIPCNEKLTNINN